MSARLRLWPHSSKIIKQNIKMTQAHSVSFWPTSFPQPLSEMSDPAPQGTKSWGNGVRAKGAEQPERDWKGRLRKWMRLWEQKVAGSYPLATFPILVASLSLYPFPYSHNSQLAWILTFYMLSNTFCALLRPTHLSSLLVLLHFPSP